MSTRDDHPPAFNELLHVGRPNVGDLDEFQRLLSGMFERRWFTNNGALVQELERRLCEYLKVRHCIMICNATVALQIVYRALNLRGEAIVPAYTFVATVHALEWQGVEPVFVDVDRRTHNLDPEQVEALITPRTTAIVGVHVWGRPCDTQRLQEIAKRHGLNLVYDAAHAFGCRHRGVMIGGFGNCEVFSFHATKFFNTFEGGAIVTNDDELAGRIRYMKNFGFAGHDNVVHLGINGKMPEVCAAMGLCSLSRLDHFQEVNRQNLAAYQRRLGSVPGLRVVTFDDQDSSNCQYVVVEVDAQVAGISRDGILEKLHANNVIARRYFYPGVHRMEPYRTRYPQHLDRLPETDGLCRRVICLPTGTAICETQIAIICDIVRAACRSN